MMVEKKSSDIYRGALKVRFEPAGLFLYDRLTGVNVLFDEIKIPPPLWSRAPRHVSIALTNNCDLSCRHCYASKNTAILDCGQLKDWLVELDANGCIGAGFGGGEPTLYHELPELCSFAVDHTNLAVVVTTHGQGLDAPLLGKLAGNVHFVRVSMDGIGETYESIRGRPFATLLEHIAALGRATRFGINYVVNARTIGDLDGAAAIAADLGAMELLLIPEVAAGRGTHVDDKTRGALQNWVRQYRGSVRLAISAGGSAGFPACNPLETEDGLAAFAHIDASGILKGTSYDCLGVKIGKGGVMKSLEELKIQNKGDSK